MEAVFRRRRDKESSGPAGPVVNFKYTAGDSLTGWTTSRASSATYFDTNGVVQTAGSGVMRDGHFLGGVRHWLLEPARTNSAIQSGDLTQAAWTKAGALPPTIGGSVTTPDNTASVVTVGIIGANTAASDERVVNAAAYAWTATTPEAWSCFAKPGNKSNLLIETTDKAGTVARSWVNVTTGAAGTTAGTHTLKLWPLTNGWYRIEMRLSSSGTGATGQTVGFIFTDADNSTTLTGDGATVNGYVWGVQMENDQLWPCSYVATTTVAVTRNADTATRPHGSTPQPRALYAKITNLLGGNSTTHDILSIGGIGGANDQYMRFAAVASPKAQMDNNASFVAAAPVNVPAVGDVLEFRAASNTDTSITAGNSINGGAEVTATSAASAAYQAGYTGANYVLGNTMTVALAIQQWKDVLGSAVSMATCRSA